MIGRIIWLAALSGIALVTTALQIDKQSETNAALALLVPEPLRNFAQTRIATDAVQGSDPALALAESERLVRRRPMPSEYLSLLAASQAKAGRLQQAAITIQVAGKRGWRDPMAQEAVLRLALAAGDKAEAARRYFALFLRGETPDALLLEVGPAVLDEAGGPGQATLVDVVVGGKRWRAQFLGRGSRVMPPAAFAAIVTDSIAQGAVFDCGQLAQAIRVLSRRDAAASVDLASAVGTGACPQLAAKEKPAL